MCKNCFIQQFYRTVFQAVRFLLFAELEITTDKGLS